jgi:hypothetical protein
MNNLAKVLLGLGIGVVVVAVVWIFYVIPNFGDYAFEVEGSENIFGDNAGSVQVDYRKGLWNQTDPDAGDNYTLSNITDPEIRQSAFTSSLDIEQEMHNLGLYAEIKQQLT